MYKESLRDKIYLAALLHDIGKFWQRADKLDIQESNEIKEHIKNILGDISNITQDGFATHAHVAYTLQFFENKKSLFNQLLNDDKTNINLGNLSAKHHKPKQFEEKIIQLADWWSSGFDRTRTYDTPENKVGFKERPLHSIFNSLNLRNNEKKENKNYYINLNQLSLNKNIIFPTEKHNVNQVSYNKLWKDFVFEFDKLEIYKDFRIFADTLCYLLQKYTWCIPASTLKKEIHDSSLFEHLKTTAAIAICLYDYLYTKKINDLEQLNEEHRPLQLVCIDISGIQNFIYNITMKGAAKALKGRSFYLQLLIDTIINEILYELNYYRSNVLYSSGGKAYLLLPNIDKVNKFLSDYHEKIENWLFDKFKGNIYISIGKATFYFDKTHDEEKKYLIDNEETHSYIGDLWKKTLDNAAKYKNKKFKSVIIGAPDFFEPFGSGGETETCDLTGDEIEKNDVHYLDEFKFSSNVIEQIELGKTLKESTYLVWSSSYNNPIINYNLYNFKKQPTPLKIHNSYWYFFNENSKPTSIDNALIYKLVENEKGLDFLNTIPGNSVKSFRFYAGTTNIESFSDLIEDKNANFKRLAAYVMDIDNLGKIFVEGFKNFDNNRNLVADNSSFSRLTTLSFFLDLFFSGYINVIKRKYENTLMIIYSGGDDLLAIGDWKSILNFVEDVRNEFFDFVCHKPEISFSGGIALFNEKFPVSKAIDLAKEAEGKAKSFNKNRKGYLGIFGNVVSLKMNDDEFLKIKNIKNSLVNFYKNQIITSSFIQRFQLIYELKNINEEKNNLSYRWTSAYFFSRYEKRVKNKTHEFSDFMKKLYDDLALFLNQTKIDLTISERNYDLYAIAARWAELEIRSLKSETKTI
ncbi:MAG: type III-A CRISPR-associated protein Cas10/Csm1 [Vicingaceae bacterium]|nr:MAG: type III-A CRISPR-associated protein Cas10/Csm1 [Vicingaceae bacterium]